MPGCFCGAELDVEGHCEGCGELAFDCECVYGDTEEDEDFDEDDD